MLIQEYGPISVEEYLHIEARSQTRHEYVDGEVFELNSGTLRHNVIAGNLAAALHAHLRKPLVGYSFTMSKYACLRLIPTTTPTWW